MGIQKAIDELVDYVGDVHRQTISPDTITMARKALELQSEINKLCIREFVDKLIIQLNEEKKFDPCRNTNCDKCPYTKGCYEGELAHKVSIDNIIEIVNKLVKEFCAEDNNSQEDGNGSALIKLAREAVEQSEKEC